MKKIFFIATFVVLFFIPSNVFASVVINEVYYDPEGGNDTGKEYIILYNNGDSGFNLTNYELNAVSGDYFVFPSFSLNPESFVTVHWRKEGTNSLTDLYTRTSGFDANMGNKNGWVALFNDSSHNKDTIIDYIEYGMDGNTWESTAEKAGIWTAEDFIPDVDEGKAIKLKTNGQDNNSSNDWEEAEPLITEEEPTSSEETPTGTPPIIAGNNPPIANAGDNIIGFIGQEIKFDGTKSSDLDKDELFYSWNMGDGKLIEKPVFTYKYLYAGTYLVSLMVYDGRNYAWDTITIKIQSQEITINEFIPNPEGIDEESEWIEIYNDSDSIVDISDWQLDDEANGSEPFIFPENSLIAPKSYVVFPRQITKIALNNDKDKVRLLLPEGIVFQEVNYENPKQGQSSAQTDQGFVWSPPTPGMANIINPSQGIGGLEEEKPMVYQGQVKSETTKQPSEDYSWYYNKPEQEIEGGYIESERETPAFAEATAGKKGIQGEIYSKSDFWNQNNLNLILMIITVVLAGSIIGLIFTRFLKPKNPYG